MPSCKADGAPAMVSVAEAAVAAVLAVVAAELLQFKAMANKFGYQQDTLEFAKHWVTLDAGQRLALMDRFYG
eukprot:gene18048-25336_t